MGALTMGSRLGTPPTQCLRTLRSLNSSPTRISTLPLRGTFETSSSYTTTTRKGRWEARKVAVRDVVLLREPHRLRDPRGPHGRSGELPDGDVPVHPPGGTVAVQLARGDGHHLLARIRHYAADHHDTARVLQGPLGEPGGRAWRQEKPRGLCALEGPCEIG